MNGILPNLQFKLVSPEQVLFTGEATMVVIPASSGDLGVLYNHAPTVVTLGKGIIDIYQGEKRTERLFVGGGFANINEQGCTVMADDAISVEDLVEEEIAAHIKRIEADIEQAEVEEEKLALRQDLTISIAKIEIIKMLKK